MPVASGDNGDLVDIGERLRHGPHHVGQAGNQLVHHGCLVVLLIGFCLDVHGLSLSFAFLEDDVGLSFALHARGTGAAFSFCDQALLLRFRQVEYALLLDFRLLQHGGDQLILVARDFRFLHLGLLFFLNQLYFHLLRHNELLLYVLLDFIGLVSLGLLLLDQLGICGLFHFQVALGFCLLGLGERLRQHALLICLSACNGSITFGLGGGDIGVTLDAGHIWPAHVGDVLILVADFLDGE